MPDILAELGHIGVVPVVKIDRAADAVPLGEALLAGDLPCAEITFRTAAAEEAIANLAAACPDVLLGAGTVLTVDQAQRAVRAGAHFIVSPGFSPALADWCLAQGVPAVPGAATPTEIMAALERGFSVLKFFPAEVYGGPAALKALSAPFGQVRFMPTGGVNTGNLAAYLGLSCVHSVGGSWMVDARLIAAGQFGEITHLAAEARAIVRAVRGS